MRRPTGPRPRASIAPRPAQQPMSGGVSSANAAGPRLTTSLEKELRRGSRGPRRETLSKRTARYFFFFFFFFLVAFLTAFLTAFLIFFLPAMR